MTIHSTSPAFKQNAHNALADKLTAALLKLQASDESAKAVLTSINAKYTGCESAKAEDYETIRTMIQTIYGDKFYVREPAPEAFDISSGHIAKGTAAALRFEVIGLVDGAPVVVLEHITRLTDDICPDWPQPAQAV